MLNLLLSCALYGVSVAESAEVNAFGDLLRLAFPDGDAPEFQRLHTTAPFWVANNDTALLKVSSIAVDPFPVIPGHNDIGLEYSLPGSLPPGSVLDLVAFENGNLLYRGEIDLCEVMAFAKLECPLENVPFGTLTRALSVPEDADDGSYSFYAHIRTPSNSLVVDLAGIVRVDGGSKHDEL